MRPRLPAALLASALLLLAGLIGWKTGWLWFTRPDPEARSSTTPGPGSPASGRSPT